MDRYKRVDIFCKEHMIKNEFICNTDNKEICKLCLSNHENHQIIPLEPLQNLNVLKDLTVGPKNLNRYVNSGVEELKQIKISYLELRNQICNILDGEIENIDSMLNLSELKSNREEISTKNSSLTYPLPEIYPNRKENKSTMSNPQENLKRKLNTSLDKYSNLTNINSKYLNRKSTNEENDKLSENELPRINQSMHYPKNTNLLPDKIKKDSNENINRLNPLMNNIVFKLDKEPGSIYLYDSKHVKGSKINLQNFRIANDSALAYCRNNVLISGGKSDNGGQLSLAFLLDIRVPRVSNLNKMLVEKRSHTLINIDEENIYSVGGYNNSLKYLATVEKYNIETDKWSQISPLPVGRQDISICSFSSQILFSFGGAIYNKATWIYFNNIEKLKLDNDRNEWEEIYLSGNEGWTPRVFVGTRQISSDTIMIFGGFDSNHYNDVLLFNTESFSITDSHIRLKKKCSFIQRNAEINSDESNLFAVGFPFIDIHRYSFAEKYWKYLDSKKWFNNQL